MNNNCVYFILTRISSLLLCTFYSEQELFIFLYCTVPAIEEGFIKKPRQTVVIAFWGKMATHMLLLRLCSRQIVKRRAGSKLLGGYLYITYFIIDRLVFHQMFCCSLANKMINKINKSVFKLEIQIYIKQQGKVQQLCTQ